MNKISLITFYLLLITLFSLLITTMALAVPSQMNYQGVLKTSTGALVSGEVSMDFAIYAAATGGTPVWSETQNIVTVEAGLYSVQLGSVNGISQFDFDGTTRYLGVSVPTNGTEMLPRIPLVTVPYAFRAGTAESSVNTQTLDGLSASDFVRFGTSESQSTSEQYGARLFSTHTSGYGLYASAEGTSGTGIMGESIFGAGVAGQSVTGRGVSGISTSNDGVYGISTNTAGIHGVGSTHGGSFEVTGSGVGASGTSVGGAGLSGISTTGRGVKGESSDNDGVYGESTNAKGVRGTGASHGGYFEASASGGQAVYGEAGGVNGRGVYAVATHTSGSNFGAYASSSSTGGWALVATNTAASDQSSHGGSALKVDGMILVESGNGKCFGEDIIANASSSKTTTNTACDITSLVLVSLVQDPGANVSIRDVTPLAGSFVVTLTGNTGNQTRYRYLIIN